MPEGRDLVILEHACHFNGTYFSRWQHPERRPAEGGSENYNVHVFSGHTHFFQNNEVSPVLYEHNIGAACGGWWTGWVNQCGAPNGYMVVELTEMI